MRRLCNFCRCCCCRRQNHQQHNNVRASLTEMERFYEMSAALDAGDATTGGALDALQDSPPFDEVCKSKSEPVDSEKPRSVLKSSKTSGPQQSKLVKLLSKASFREYFSKSESVDAEDTQSELPTTATLAKIREGEASAEESGGGASASCSASSSTRPLTANNEGGSEAVGSLQTPSTLVASISPDGNIADLRSNGSISSRAGAGTEEEPTSATESSKSSPMLKRGASYVHVEGRRKSIRATQYFEEHWDEEKQEQLASWLQNVTGKERNGEPLWEWLSNGEVLCTLANQILPGSVPKVHKNSTAFHERDNVKAFLLACKCMGVHEEDQFYPEDLVDVGNVKAVAACLFILSERVKTTIPTFTGPYLDFQIK